MDGMLRDKAEKLAKEIAVTISTQEELSDMMRLMTKTVIERILDAEMDVHLGRSKYTILPQDVGNSSSVTDYIIGVPTTDVPPDTPQNP